MWRQWIHLYISECVLLYLWSEVNNIMIRFVAQLHFILTKHVSNHCRMPAGCVIFTHPTPATAPNTKYCHGECYHDARPAQLSRFESTCSRCQQVIPKNSPIERFNAKWAHHGCSEVQAMPTFANLQELAASALLTSQASLLKEPLSFEVSC